MNGQSMSFNCPCSTRKPSCPNGESISWYVLPAIMPCSSRISAGVKTMSVVMPTTVVRAPMRARAAATPPRPRPVSWVSKALSMA